VNILSITFHIEQNIISIWDNFIYDKILNFIKNTKLVERYTLSEVKNAPQNEGKNYNLLIFFVDKDIETKFCSTKLPKLSKIIQDKFPNNEVMFFITNLGVLSHNL